METFAVVVVSVVVMALLMRRIRKVENEQLALLQYLKSIAPMPGYIQLTGGGFIQLYGEESDRRQTTIRAGTLTLETRDGPQLKIEAVPGSLRRYLWLHDDDREREHEVADGAGFDIAYTPPTLPDQPLPPHIRLEFRDDTVTIRTWKAKIVNAEWQIGDGY